MKALADVPSEERSEVAGGRHSTDGLESSPAPIRAERALTSAWDGTESPWVVAAKAAAPWPLWSLALLIGAPGATPWLHGVLALSFVFGAMVVWVHRPPLRVALARWLPSVLGTGLMGELLANALTDMGRAGGLSAASDLARAIATGLVVVALYEIAPTVAAACRVSPREHRTVALDAVAYTAFALCVGGAYVWAPTSRGGWYLSPWIAALIALPLAAVRSGPRAAAILPGPPARRGVMVALALVAWLLIGAIFAGALPELRDSLRRTWRWGTDPLEGALWALPALSLLLSLLAAASLFARGLRARHAPSGRVTGLGDGGLTLERAGDEEPAWVAIEGEPLPPEGAAVTLLGVRTRSADAGPFRDGAPTIRARRAWAGTPDELARVLEHRAAGWLVWAAACALGLWLRT